MTGIDKDIFRATRNLTTLLNEACNHWNYLCPHLAELSGAADRALEGYARDYPEDVKTLIAERPAPLRNCDVGTAAEQGERCLAQFDKWRRKGDGKKLITAIMEWAQTPYKDQKGDCDGL